MIFKLKIFLTSRNLLVNKLAVSMFFTVVTKKYETNFGLIFCIEIANIADKNGIENDHQFDTALSIVELDVKLVNLKTPTISG